MILTALDVPSRFSLVLSESVLCPISLAQPITGDAPYSRLPLTEQRVKSCNIHCCLTINYVTFQVTPIYYGNYVKGKLSPFYGYYRVKDGSFHDNSINREISLPIGTYNMIYWGTPQYQTPIYAHPAIKEAAHSIGADMSKQSLGLFRISADTIYYPVFDLVYATQPVNIGSESLSGSLKRVVAGIKVVLKDKDNAVLSSSIDSVSVRITNIYSELNYYTGKPQGTPRTIAFPLIRSNDGTQMSNSTVMLFPSAGKPEFQLAIILKNGNVKSFRQALSSPLDANAKLTLTLSLGDIFSEESSGDFTVDDWNEKNENIDIPIIE